MLGLTVETRKLEGNKTLSGDLARHIRSHYREGKIAIVTDRPTALMSAVSKQWHKIIRQTERERSSTLNPRKSMLDEELASLQQVSFSAKLPIYDPQANVCFATANQFLQAPPICRTLYITYGIEKHEQYMLTAWMPPRGLVVFYGG
jgi:hypothetical protein